MFIIWSFFVFILLFSFLHSLHYLIICIKLSFVCRYSISCIMLLLFDDFHYLILCINCLCIILSLFHFSFFHSLHYDIICIILSLFDYVHYLVIIRLLSCYYLILVIIWSLSGHDFVIIQLAAIFYCLHSIVII